MQDLAIENLKDVPGFKGLLKAVLKSQIQLLVEQLAKHTDEESIVLSASISDGALSYLGSGKAKDFLEEREDLKSQFLRFCLKKHHKKKGNETDLLQGLPYGDITIDKSTHSLPPPSTHSNNRLNAVPVSNGFSRKAPLHHGPSSKRPKLSTHVESSPKVNHQIIDNSSPQFGINNTRTMTSGNTALADSVNLSISALKEKFDNLSEDSMSSSMDRIIVKTEPELERTDEDDNANAVDYSIGSNDFDSYLTGQRYLAQHGNTPDSHVPSSKRSKHASSSPQPHLLHQSISNSSPQFATNNSRTLAAVSTALGQASSLSESTHQANVENLAEDDSTSGTTDKIIVKTELASGGSNVLDQEDNVYAVDYSISNSDLESSNQGFPGDLGMYYAGGGHLMQQSIGHIFRGLVPDTLLEPNKGGMLAGGAPARPSPYKKRVYRKVECEFCHKMIYITNIKVHRYRHLQHGNVLT